jgi:pre-mRNA cleavage complex 2 protein Pcf11
MLNQHPQPDQLAAIKSHVDQLSQFVHALPQTPNPPPTYVSSPPILAQVVPVVPIPQTQVPVQQPSLSTLFGSGGTASLAALLARQSATPQPTPPPQAASTTMSPKPRSSQPVSGQPPSGSTSTPVPDPSALLERLRAAGILKGTTSNPSTPSPLGFPPSLTNTPPTSRTPLGEIPNDVVLKPASLKIPRPHLIARLYQNLGVPCTQCGRRFQIDEEGKKKKAAHMDWHFRVHQRMVEAEKRGQHRSWYLDELDWIKSREADEDQFIAADGSNGSGDVNSSAVVAKPRAQYIPVPDDSEGVNNVCPICQEKFEMKWLDDAQEFVWMDAQKVNDRVYHATCFAEVSKDDSSSHVKRGTPEPVLGKRKAEVS